MFETSEKNTELFQVFRNLEGSLLLKAAFLVRENLAISKELNLLPEHPKLEMSFRAIIRSCKAVLQEFQTKQASERDSSIGIQVLAGTSLLQRVLGAFAVCRVIHSLKKGSDLLDVLESLHPSVLIHTLSEWKVDTSNPFIDSLRDGEFSGFVGDLVQVFDLNLMRMKEASKSDSRATEVLTHLETLTLVMGALIVLGLGGKIGETTSCG